MSNPENDPAFPVQSYADHEFTGMSLRDYFAAAAASGYTSNQEWMKNVRFNRPDIDTCDAIAQASYEVADAMLAARYA